MPENGGFGGQKRTKMPILCSKCPKTRVSEGKSAQKPRFCARKARKQGFQTPKAHKNLDFVLGKSQNQGNIAVSDTKMPFLCSKCQKMGVPKAKKAQKPRFCAQKARKRGFQTPKAHKNADSVLEMPENEGFGGEKRTKTSILCSEGAKTREISPFLTQKCRFCARETNAGLRETESEVWAY